MILALIVIIMIIWIWIVGSIYASVWPFLYQVWNTVNYNVAYYIAVMNVERSLLALRYHDAWFEWESGKSTGSLADRHDIAHPYGFSKFDTDTNADMYRRILSRSAWIPATGQGNIESLFAGTGSEDYNSLGYYEWLELPLYLDATSSPTDYYTNATTFTPVWWWIWSIRLVGNFRLPPKIKAWLNNENLDDSVDIDSDNIFDDIILNRWLQWYDTIDNTIFTIIPTIRNNFAINTPIYEFDNAIRESVINQWGSTDNIQTEGVWVNTFWYHFALPGGGASSSIENHNILPLSSIQSGSNFDSILNDNSLQNLTLNFNITNRMKTPGENIYPFLEWRLRACGIAWCNEIMPDRFYNIEWVGQVWRHTVRLQIKKPVRETSNASNFTIIF